jgi:hypothetical protein
MQPFYVDRNSSTTHAERYQAFRSVSTVVPIVGTWSACDSFGKAGVNISGDKVAFGLDARVQIDVAGMTDDPRHQK